MKGISGKLVTLLVSLSLVVILLVGAMEYHAGKLAIDNKLDDSLKTVSHRLMYNLRNSVYTFDVETAKDIILGEFPKDEVNAILLWTQERKQLLVGLARQGGKIVDVVKPPQNTQLIRHSFSLEYESLETGSKMPIGVVDLFLDRSILEERLKDSLIITLSKVSLVIVIVLGIFELVVTRALVRPLEQIHERIYASGENDESNAGNDQPLSGFRELKELNETYHMMLDTIKKRQNQLVASEHNYSEIFNATNEAILLFNAKNGNIIDANKAMINMFDYRSKKLLLSENIDDVFCRLFDLTTELTEENVRLAMERGAYIFECGSKGTKENKLWIEVSLMSSQIGGKDSVLAVMRDITKRKEYEEALQYNQKILEDRVAIRTKELQVKNKELESFSYMVSHDLRSPLRSIDGFCQILSEDYDKALDEKGKNYLARVRAASQRLGMLIDDLLQLSRVSRQELNITNVDLSALVNMTAEKHLALNKTKYSIVIEKNIFAQCDEVLMQVVIDNLLDNAIKYSSPKENPRIEFGLLNKDGQSVYFIKDNGVGFESEYVNKIFLPFQRLHGTEFEGTGIGLASVHTIIDHHGGKIWAESTPGEGSTFYFTLAGNSQAKQQKS